MANPNGRPPRLGVRAERLTVYVHPDTRRILFESAREVGQQVGEVIDGLVSDANGEEAGRQLGPSAPITFGQGDPVSVIKVRAGFDPMSIVLVKHKPKIVNGGIKVCEVCGLSDKKWAVSCPGKEG